jgi:hypothetical protein
VLDGVSVTLLRNGSRLVANIRAVVASTAQISVIAPVDQVILRTPLGISANEAFELSRRGNSSIKRSAMALTSVGVHRPSGNRAIDEANLSPAAFFGSWASSTASSQGSICSRVSAERTLSGIPFRSASIGAWRNLSNSGLKNEIEEAGVIQNSLSGQMKHGAPEGRK